MKDNDWKTWALGVAMTMMLSFLSAQIVWTREDIKELRHDLTSHMLGMSEK